MPTRQLYNVRIPRDSQTNTTHQDVGRQLESLSALDDDIPSIEAIGVDVGEHTIEAAYSNKYAQKIAGELEALLQANNFDHLPYFTPSDPGRSGDGYIAVETGSIETASVHDDRFQVVSATVTLEGTRRSHRRAVSVQPAEVHRNDFGNDTTALVAIPSTAEKRTWIDRETQSRDTVSVSSTEPVELGEVDIIDANNVSLTTSERPIDLVYKIPYADEIVGGVTLWDTRGEYTRDDLDGDVQWRKCYRTDRDYTGTPVIDTGRLRLYLDESRGVGAREWNESTNEWVPVSLPESDWSLRDVDITQVAPVTVEAQCEFEHPTEGLYALDVVAARGRRVVHWLVPESVSDPTPSGLIDLLDPIADPSVVRPQASQDLIPRSNLRY